jgi:hypothetical protein
MPNEVLCQIFLLVAGHPFSDERLACFTVLCRVSQRFHWVVMKLMYGYLCLEDTGKKNLDLMYTLTINPHLALEVAVCNISLTGDNHGVTKVLINRLLCSLNSTVLRRLALVIRRSSGYWCFIISKTSSRQTRVGNHVIFSMDPSYGGNAEFSSAIDELFLPDLGSYGADKLTLQYPLSLLVKAIQHKIWTSPVRFEISTTHKFITEEVDAMREAAIRENLNFGRSIRFCPAWVLLILLSLVKL